MSGRKGTLFDRKNVRRKVTPGNPRVGETHTARRITAGPLAGRSTSARGDRILRPLATNLAVTRSHPLLRPQMRSPLWHRRRRDTRPPTGHATGHAARHAALALRAPGTERATEGQTGAASRRRKGIRQRKRTQTRLVRRVHLPPVLGLGDLVGLVVLDVGPVCVVRFVGVY